MKSKLITLLPLLLFAGCATKPTTTYWFNDPARAEEAANRIKYQGMNILSISTVPTFVVQKGDETEEIGLRSDGVVVWRKEQP